MEESAEYYNDTAVVLAAKGQHAEAIACLRKGLSLDPKNPILYFNLALSSRAVGKLEDAKNALLQAAKSNPLDVDVLDTLGVVLHESGDDLDAEESYRHALELEPGNGRVWNNYGVLLFGQSRFDEACKAFEKAVTLVPDFDDALYNLRDTYEELGRTDDMKKCAAILERRGVL